MSETLMDGLLSEIERCSKLKAMYDEIPSGAFGALVIQQAIDNAKASVASGDIEQMIIALKVCEGCKGMERKMDEETKGLDTESWQIARNVREGIRTKADLRRCGCKNCIEALRILERER